MKLMAFCRTCGKQIHEKAVVCPSCGVPAEATGIESPIAYIVSGYLCAVFTFLFLPLGLAGILIGAANLFKGRTVHGLLQIGIAVFSGLIGVGLLKS